MSSPRRKRDSPIESVLLTVKFRADRDTVRKIREKVPSAVAKDWGCELSIKGEAPADVANEAKKTLDAIREMVSASKRL